jgi:hypothetical protein
VLPAENLKGSTGSAKIVEVAPVGPEPNIPFFTFYRLIPPYNCPFNTNTTINHHHTHRHTSTHNNTHQHKTINQQSTKHHHHAMAIFLEFEGQLTLQEMDGPAPMVSST